PMAPLVTRSRPGPARRDSRVTGSARAPTLVSTNGRPAATTAGPRSAAAGTPAHSTMTSEGANHLGEGVPDTASELPARTVRSTTWAPWFGWSECFDGAETRAVRLRDPAVSSGASS